MDSTQAQAMIDAINRLADVASSLFSQPTNSELAALWSIGFVLPMTLYLVAHAIGSVVNFWRQK